MRRKRSIARTLLITGAVVLLTAVTTLVITYRSARRIAATAVVEPWESVDTPVYVGTRLVRGVTLLSWPHWEVTYGKPDGAGTVTIPVGLQRMLAAQRPQYGDTWRYEGELHVRIKDADRIMVRDGGFDCCGPVDNDPVLFVIADPDELKAVSTNLRFETNQVVNACMCCGGPGIDWYKGEKRIALTACQDSAIRWKGFPGPSKYSDARLTPESSDWLRAWMKAHRGTTEEGTAHNKSTGCDLQ